MHFPITSAKEQALVSDMKRLGIAESDLEENFIKGSGAGGQKINKTSSCVQLIHQPSGIEIRCQQSRSQALNRFLARRLLVEEIESRVEGEKSRKVQEIEKIRRQKRKRSRRAKEKMLQNKKKNSEKKEGRKKFVKNDE